MSQEEQLLFPPEDNLSTVVTDISTLLPPELQAVLTAYKADLLAYNDIRDEISRDYVLGVIFNKYRETLGYLPPRIKAHASIVSRPDNGENSEERRVYELQELMDMNNTLPTWLVPNLIGAGGGLYLVSGKPKSGKTLIFGYQLAHSLTVTGEFLGFPCQKCKVLFFECEEPLPTIIKRLRTKGFHQYCDGIEQALAEGVIQVERQFKIDSDLTYLKERVEEFGPGLVIYDSLRRITSHIDMSENDAKFASLVYTLQAVHNHLGVPGLVIHHNNKTGEGLNAVSGSGGIPGATDGVILLTPTYESNRHTVILETVPREGIPVKYKIERAKNPQGFWTYETVEVLDVNPEVPKWEKRIIRQLANDPQKRYTKTELAESLQVEATYAFFSIALERLAESYQIGEDFTESGIMVYWLSDMSPWFNLEGSPILDDVTKLLACTSRAEIANLNSEWELKGSDYKNKIWDLLGDVEKLRIKCILNPKKFNKGQWVKVVDSDAAERIDGFSFSSETNNWTYSVEGHSTIYSEDELSEHEDYVAYSTEF